MIVATNPKGESLRIELHEVLRHRRSSSATTRGSRRTASRPSSRQLIAARVGALPTDSRLVRREYPTDIGPVDLLCRDGDGRAVVVEVKRVGEIAGVEQLMRYQERLDLDPRFAPTVGLFVAEQHQAAGQVFAQSRGIACVEVDLDELRDAAAGNA